MLSDYIVAFFFLSNANATFMIYKNLFFNGKYLLDNFIKILSFIRLLRQGVHRALHLSCWPERETSMISYH